MDTLPTPVPPRNEPRSAFFWMLLSSLAFSLMSVVVKRLTGRAPASQLIFARVLINLLIVIPILIWKGFSPFPQGAGRVLVVRGVAGTMSLTCLFLAIQHIPLPIAALLNWSSIVFVLLISTFVFGERLSRRTLGWIGVAVMGLLLLLGSGVWSPPASGVALSPFWLGIGVLSAFFGAIAYVSVRQATARFDPWVVIFYFTAIGTVVTAPFVDWGAGVPDQATWLEIVAMGLLATLGQKAMTEGYRRAPAGLVSTMSLMGAGFAALWSVLFFQEPLFWVQWVGMLVLAIGILFSSLKT